ncbi:hypothetical protein GIB67_016146 [Kingdonia uniflora]|uniref:F-box domain-containing protein n=1 Tax=Kingdonia uniflora TaxID=39325 RepID=A0A7J7N9I7_9MAGN|nr:hypothetical protein GIB67_016146 [Kingdonia uniflora]
MESNIMKIGIDSEKKSRRVVDLPWDIISDILSRLPIETLMCFTSISMVFYALTKDRDFIQMQLSSSSVSALHRLVSLPKSGCNSASETESVCFGFDNKNYEVERFFFKLGELGDDSVPWCYRVGEIITLGEISLRQLDDPHIRFFKILKPVILDGAFHWVLRKQGSQSDMEKILDLDIGSVLSGFILQARINRLIENEPEIMDKDLDHDPIALEYGEDGNGHMRGFSGHNNKTSVRVATPLRKVVEREKYPRTTSLQMRFSYICENSHLNKFTSLLGIIFASVGELNTIHQSKSFGCADGNNSCYLQFEKMPKINQEGSQWTDYEIRDAINMIYQNLHKLDSYLSLFVAKYQKPRRMTLYWMRYTCRAVGFSASFLEPF